MNDQHRVKENHTITIEGVSTGDCECWCLEVDAATYRRVRGDEDADLQIQIHECEVANYHNMRDQMASCCEEPMLTWRLYPDDLIGRENNGKRVRIDITVTTLLGEHHA